MTIKSLDLNIFKYTILDLLN